VLDGLGATRQICALVANGERPYTPIVVRCLLARGKVVMRQPDAATG
jgi:hypothetical protein